MIIITSFLSFYSINYQSCTNEYPTVGINKCHPGSNINILSGGVGFYTYNTINDIPTISEVTIYLKSNALDSGSKTNSKVRTYSRELCDIKNCQDDAGHILAQRLGGCGTCPINIFPQSISINRGKYRMYEEKIYNCIINTSLNSKLYWHFDYLENNTRPYQILYVANISEPECMLKEIFENPISVNVEKESYLELKDHIL